MAQRPKTRAAGTVKRSGKAKPARARRAPAKAKNAADTAPEKIAKAGRATTKARTSSAAKSAKPKATKTTAPKAANLTKTAAKKPKAGPATGAARTKVATSSKAAKPSTSKATKATARKTRPASAVKAATSVTKAESAAKLKAAKKATKAAKPLAKGRSAAAAKKLPRKPRTAPRSAEPRYLAEELGQLVDYEGEPFGAGSAAVRNDKELQDYTLQLWRQMQSGGVVNRYMRAIERAGLTIDEVWTAGVVETRSTSSTADEMRRYREKLLFRANLLEAILSETVADLHRLEGIEPGDAKPEAAEAEPTAQSESSPAEAPAASASETV